MSDTPRPPYLARLRIIEAYLRFQLQQVEKWIAEEEAKIERDQARRPLPPPPEWLIEQGLTNRAPTFVHRGDCWNVGKRSRGVDRDQAVRALTEGGVPACSHCRPDTELGLLDEA
jgi:hypothetical protein